MDQITPKEVRILENAEDIQKRREQNFKRDADELEGWIYEKLQEASDESYTGPTNLQAKIQKHKAFEAEVAANSNAIVLLDTTGTEMIEQHDSFSDFIRLRLEELHRLWELLLSRLTDKGFKLQQALVLDHFIHHCDEVMFRIHDKAAFFTTDEFGHDLEHEEVLQRKFDEFQKDMASQECRVNELVNKLLLDGHPERDTILRKKEEFNKSWHRLKQLAILRQEKLFGAHEIQSSNRDADETMASIAEKDVVLSTNPLPRFIRYIADEESWIQEKKLLVGSDDYGRDLTDVQNLKKKHKGLEAQLESHEPAIQTVQEVVEKLMDVSKLLNEAWAELKQLAANMGRKLDESLTYQQFLAKVEEEEAWITEKQQLLSVEDYGDTMAAVESLLKKHNAFETDFAAHRDRCKDICEAGDTLVKAGNQRADAIDQRCVQLRAKFDQLEALAVRRKTRLNDNSAYLQFISMADAAESWIVDKETHVRSEKVGRDLSTVETLLTKQETFDAALHAFGHEDIQNFTSFKVMLVNSEHDQTPNIQKRYADVIARWQKLLFDSVARKQQLLIMQNQFQPIEELYLTFAKKASAFNSWFENAKKILIDSVRCNSIEEIRALREAHAQFLASFSSAEADFQDLAALDKQIKNFNTGPNLYTRFPMEALEDTWRNLQKIIKERDVELAKEAQRQEESDKLRKEFAKHANAFQQLLAETRTPMVEGSDSLEQQLEATKHKTQEVQAQSGITVGLLKEFLRAFKNFDKDKSGRLNHQEFKSCLRALGHDLPMVAEGQPDVEFENILAVVDPNRDGYVSLQEYVHFITRRMRP